MGPGGGEANRAAGVRISALDPSTLERAEGLLVYGSSVVGVFTAFPAAQALYGASMGKGSLAWSDATVAGTAWQSCGSLQVPLTMAGPLFIAVGVPQGYWQDRGGIAPGLIQPTVAMSLTCAVSSSNQRRHLTVMSNTAREIVGTYNRLPGDHAVFNSVVRFNRPLMGGGDLLYTSFEAQEYTIIYTPNGPFYYFFSVYYYGIFFQKNANRNWDAQPTTGWWVKKGRFERVSDATELSSLSDNPVSIRYSCPNSMYVIDGSTNW